MDKFKIFKSFIDRSLRNLINNNFLTIIMYIQMCTIFFKTVQLLIRT